MEVLIRCPGFGLGGRFVIGFFVLGIGLGVCDTITLWEVLL